MNSFHFFETEGEFEFDIGSGIRIMGQLLVIMKTIVFFPESQELMPTHTGRFPFFEPLQFRTGAYKKLHFHLFEFAHPENKLAGDDFITESFTDLGDTERHFHASGFLYIQEVDEDSLSCFGTQVNFAGSFCGRSHFSSEHQVELAYFGPVAGAGDRTDDFLVENNLTYFIQVVGI